MDVIDETPVTEPITVPAPLTKKQRNLIHAAKYRENNREKLREYKRQYDAKKREELRIMKEIIKLVKP